MRNSKPNRRSLSQKVADKSANRNNDNSFGYLNLPEDAKIFKPKKEGNYRVNVVPYVAGKNNRDTEEGELDYEFTFWIHRIGDGDNNRNIVCPKKTYGKPCPICEQVEKLSRNYAENEDEIKALKAKQRELFNFVDPRDEDQTIMVYDTSYFRGFGQMLDARLRNFDDDEEEDDYKNFADVPGGKTLKIRFNEESYNNNKFYAPSSIDFLDRKEEMDDSIIDKAVCLDSCLKVLGYEEILKLLAGTDDVEVKPTRTKPTIKRGKVKDEEEEETEEEETPKAKKPTKKPVEEDEDEDDDDDDDEGETDRYGNRAGRAKGKPQPESSDEDDDEDDEEEEEKPVKKPTKKPSKNIEDDDDEEEEEEEDEPKRPVKKSSKKVEEDDDDDDEDKEEEKPSKKAKKKSSGGKCPCGHTFGADVYIYPECDECEFVDECDAAQDE